MEEASALSPQTIRSYSDTFCWRERVLAYDKHLDKIMLQTIVRGKVRSKERINKFADLMFDVLEKKMQSVNIKNLTMRDVKDWAMSATKLKSFALEDMQEMVRTTSSASEEDTRIREEFNQAAREFIYTERMRNPRVMNDDEIDEIILEAFECTMADLGIKSIPIDSFDASELVN